MNRAKYLNVILTINAILLAGLLWVAVADRVVLADRAIATGPRTGIPDAGAQRFEMIRELRKFNAWADNLTEKITTHEYSVKVTSMPRIEVDQNDN